MDDSDAPPPSSNPSEQADATKMIWGTNFALTDALADFTDFLHNFKPKYRNKDAPDADVKLYEHYLRRMRRTGETNLNLDVNNLKAYPRTKKLYSQLHKYPQEVVPAMDLCLRDTIVRVAEEDQRREVDGMAGVDGDEEIRILNQGVYKVRPFGVQTCNMRELNPGGARTRSLRQSRLSRPQTPTSSWPSRASSSARHPSSRT